MYAFPSPLSKLELVVLNVIVSLGFCSADAATVSVSSVDTTAIKNFGRVSIENCYNCYT